MVVNGEAGIGRAKALVMKHGALLTGVAILAVLFFQAGLQQWRWEQERVETEQCIEAVENSHLPFIVVGPRGKVLGWSHGAEDAMGISKEKAIGSELPNIMAQADGGWECLKQWGNRERTNDHR